MKQRKKHEYKTTFQCKSCNLLIVGKRGQQKLCDVCAPTSAAKKRFDRYGISQPQFDEMFLNQNGLCFLCSKQLQIIEGHINGMHIDHDHLTCKVRGLLCGTCNTGIGHIDRIFQILGIEGTFLYLKRIVNSTKNLDNKTTVCEICGNFLDKKCWKQKRCKDCVPDKSSHAHAYRYGLSKQQFENLMHEQHEQCYICNNKLHNDTINGMHVDHIFDAINGIKIVRGILCGECNHGIGYLEKMLKFINLNDLISYLKGN